MFELTHLTVDCYCFDGYGFISLEKSRHHFQVGHDLQLSKSGDNADAGLYVFRTYNQITSQNFGLKLKFQSIPIFAVITIKILTNIHSFGGTLPTDIL